MKVLIVDNNHHRHDNHQLFIDQFPSINFILKKNFELSEFGKEKFDVYVIHQGNHQEYNFVYAKSLGHERIFFSGGERNPQKTQNSIFTDTENLYKEIEDVIASNS